MDYIGTWKEVMLKPSEFYRKMPKTGGYRDPLTFAAITFLIYGILTAIFNRDMYMTGMHGGMYGGENYFGEFGLSMIISIAILAPIAGVISLFIEAIILYIIYRILGGDGSYEGTVRFIAYASAVLLLSWIPLIGWIIGLYGIYLQIVGGMYVHNVSMLKSAIAVLLPTILLFILMIILIGAMVAFLGVI